MPGRFLPPDPSSGDPDTIGGYMAVHARPAAFEGSDGLSYSVAIEAEPTGEANRPFGAYFLFLRWRRIGAQGVEGHLETRFLAWGATAEDACTALGVMRLSAVRETLESLIQGGESDTPARRWWDIMREEE